MTLAFLDKAGVVIETRREHRKRKREVEGKENKYRLSSSKWKGGKVVGWKQLAQTKSWPTLVKAETFRRQREKDIYSS